MTKKINTKAFCEAWNKSTIPKESPWINIFDEYMKENPPFDNDRTSLMSYLINNYEPPKLIER